MTSKQKRMVRSMTPEQQDAWYAARRARFAKRDAGKTPEQLRAEYTAQEMRGRINEEARQAEADVCLTNDPRQ
jgi:uncharacterized ferritin-like protein (DUF455 family)